MVVDTLTAPHSRVLDALTIIGAHYGVSEQVETVRRAEDGWQDEALAALAEATAALLIEVKPAATKTQRGRR